METNNQPIFTFFIAHNVQQFGFDKPIFGLPSNLSYYMMM